MNFWKRLLGINHYIKIEGHNLERFINLCTNSDIELWGIKQENNCIHACTCGACDDRLKELSLKANVTLTIEKKTGLLSRVILYRFRIGFYCMPVVFVGILYWLFQFIWSVEINGNHQVTDDRILSFLKENQWYYACDKGNIDSEYLEQQIKAHFPEVTWVNVLLEGTCLQIDIKENPYIQTENDFPVDTTQSGDILATKDGTIVAIVTRAGIPLCQIGDSVVEGQVLVSGAIPIYDNVGESILRYHYVEADADILIDCKIWYYDFIPYETTVKEYSGNHTCSYFLFSPLGIRKSTDNTVLFEQYDRYSQCYQLRLFDNFYLPLFYGKIENWETVSHSVYRNDEQVEFLLLDQYSRYLDSLELQNIFYLDDSLQYIYTTEGIYFSGDIWVRCYVTY